MYSIHNLSQFMKNPKKPHYDAAIHILCYLKSSPGRGLLFPSSSDLILCSYANSNWATCPMTRDLS